MRNFMYGRYGIDELGKFMAIIMLILYFIGALFLKGNLSIAFRTAAVIIFIIFCFRVFSRNTTKRYDENTVFLNFKNSVSAKKYKIRSSKRSKTKANKNSQEYAFFTCENCGTITRVPKGKGKIIITCPICKNKFEAKS